MTTKTADHVTRACSAKEIFQIARKACIGSGLTHDRAEDLAEATTLLQCSGHAGLAALYRLLVRQGKAPHTHQLKLSLLAGQMQIDHLRPEAEGVAVIDWLVAGKGPAELHKLDDPLILAGLLMAAARSYGGQFLVHKAGLSAPLVISDPQRATELASDQGLQLSYQPCASASKSAPVLCHHTEVELAVWQACERLAHLTYVPASAASRQSGAGAGLVDND